MSMPCPSLFPRSALALTLTWAGCALAAGGNPPAATDLPPALPEATAPAAKASAPRQRIDLPVAPPAEVAAKPAAEESLVPTEEELAAARKKQAAKPADDHETRIVEVVRGKRVVEVVVTPGLTQRSYVMENRATPPSGAPGSDNGTLSVPRFIRLDF